MISKQYIKDLEFSTIEDIFNYIVESKINGNYSQTRELVQKLSKSQFKDFLRYLNNNMWDLEQQCLFLNTVNTVEGFTNMYFE